MMEVRMDGVVSAKKRAVDVDANASGSAERWPSRTEAKRADEQTSRRVLSGAAAAVWPGFARPNARQIAAESGRSFGAELAERVGPNAPAEEIAKSPDRAQSSRRANEACFFFFDLGAAGRVPIFSSGLGVDTHSHTHCASGQDGTIASEVSTAEGLYRDCAVICIVIPHRARRVDREITVFEKKWRSEVRRQTSCAPTSKAATLAQSRVKGMGLRGEKRRVSVVFAPCSRVPYKQDSLHARQRLELRRSIFLVAVFLSYLPVFAVRIFQSDKLPTVTESTHRKRLTGQVAQQRVTQILYCLQAHQSIRNVVQSLAPHCTHSFSLSLRRHPARR
ncbi:hypothetical protein L1887_40490 [Cichorium endivia]|nr:hypothetical protein L1887_40490 [Cichorium endivia]